MTLDDFPIQWALDDGTNVTIRPIQPEDAEIEQSFVKSLSPLSKFFRFFMPLKQLSPAALEKFTHNKYPTDFALIATTISESSEVEIGVARFAPGSRDGWAEFAVVVADGWQGQGIATQLLLHLFTLAAGAGIKGIEGSILRENSRMLRLVRQQGFTIKSDPLDPNVYFVHKDF